MATEADQYVCWINVLRRTPYDKWSEAVKRDFGGVQLLKNAEEAQKYVFQNATRLFSGRLPGRVRPRLFKAGDEQNERLLVVTIDPATANTYIFERLETLLEAKREDLGEVKTAGRPKFVAREGKYRLTAKVDVEATLVVVDVLDLLSSGKVMSYAEVGEWIAKRYPLALKPKSIEKGSQRTKAMSSLGSRYVKKAIQMTEAVAQGRFPE